MIKKRILIAAGSAVLFGCIIFATVHISRMNNMPDNSSNTMSTTQVSEYISIRDEGVLDNTVQPGTSVNNTSGEEITSQDNTVNITQPPTSTDTATTHQSVTSAVDSTTGSAVKGTEKDSSTANESTSVAVTETTVISTSTNPTTIASVTTAPTVDVNSEDNAVFSFTKIIVDKPDFDYYTKLVTDKGYMDVQNLEELAAYGKDMLSLKDGKKQVKYIITPKGLFDDLASDMDLLKSKAETEPSFYNFNDRDRFLFDSLGLDYQYYYSNGVALFMIKKVQDIENNVGSHSVYAIYYYAYNTYEQLALQDEAVNNATSSFSGTDYDKILAAHEYLRSRVSYVDNGSYMVQTAYRALINKEAVCEGYAKAYKLLLNSMGIECDIVINAEHAWNVVQLDGKWYLVDVTNDDSNNGLMYFLLGADVLMSDNDTAHYFGYIDGSNTDVRTLAETGYVPIVEEPTF